MTADRERVVAFLSDDSTVLARRVVHQNPWFCQQLGLDLEVWSRALLDAHGLETATLRLIGSAATGFSLSPEKAGRVFRKVGGVHTPSDLDMALVDETLFRTCWDEMVGLERRAGQHYLVTADREHVYWGRIDDHRIPYRARARAVVRTLIDAVRRSPEFRGYPTNIRIYRRHEDLLHYVVRCLQLLVRRIGE